MALSLADARQYCCDVPVGLRDQKHILTLGCAIGPTVLVSQPWYHNRYWRPGRTVDIEVGVGDDKRRVAGLHAVADGESIQVDAKVHEARRSATQSLCHLLACFF